MRTHKQNKVQTGLRPSLVLMAIFDFWNLTSLKCYTLTIADVGHNSTDFTLAILIFSSEHLCPSTGSNPNNCGC